MTRREFISCGAAFAASPFIPDAALAAAKDGLRLRFGVMADIHINLMQWSQKKWPVALKWFDKQGADAIMVCGDMADYGVEVELKLVADEWFKVFPGNCRSDGQPVVNLLHYGDHDMSHGIYKRLQKANMDKYYGGEEGIANNLIWNRNPGEIWERCFHEKWAPVQIKNVKGYDFVLSHFTIGEPNNKWGNNTPELGPTLAGHKFDPKKPFFHSQHRLYRGTVCGPIAWGQEDGSTGRLLSKYPNCVAFCGHGHYMAQQENMIWQGDYTALQVPSLSYLSTESTCRHENGYGSYCGKDKDERTSPPQMGYFQYGHALQVYLVDVYDDRIVIHRHEVSTDLPVADDWVIPLDAATRPYTHAAIAERAKAPQFAASAKATWKVIKGKDRKGEPTDQLEVTFPVATSPRAYDFEVVVAAGEKRLKRNVYSNRCCFPPSKDTDPGRCLFALAELPAAPEACRIAVRPREIFGKAGKAIMVKGKKA